MELSREELFLLNGSKEIASNVSEPESLKIILPVTAVYLVIFIAGVLGNVSTCIVIQRNRSMHTATNFYLFSLAISDLLLLICGLPIEVYRLWYPLSYPLNEAMCISAGMISETSANATVLTITAFTIERYIAICWPFVSHSMSKLSRAVRLIIIIWIFSVLTALPQAMQFGLVSYDDNGSDVRACTVTGNGVHLVFVISTILFFAIPTSLITILYILIGIKLKSSNVLKPSKRNSAEKNERVLAIQRYSSVASQKRVIRMLVAVALSFFICWAPFHIQRLLAVYGKNLENPTDTFYIVYIVLTYLSGILYFLSTAINPFLYNIMSNKFRNAFKMTLSRWCSDDTTQLERRYRYLMGSPNRHAVMVMESRRRNPRLSRVTTAAICEPPPRAQSYNRPDVALVTEGPDERTLWRQRFRARTNHFALPQSISNSSLHEYDPEFSSEELTTFMYQVNRSLSGVT